jgi:hypothetical protein
MFAYLFEKMISCGMASPYWRVMRRVYNMKKDTPCLFLCCIPFCVSCVFAHSKKKKSGKSSKGSPLPIRPVDNKYTIPTLRNTGHCPWKQNDTHTREGQLFLKDDSIPKSSPVPLVPWCPVYALDCSWRKTRLEKGLQSTSCFVDTD